MENATKALLIAAAILVAIIIISIGIAVVNKGQEAVSDADLSEAQMEAFNAKFKAYEGSNVSTADVNALCSKVISHNQNAANTGEPTVTVTGEVITITETTNSFTKLNGNTRYTVTCTYANGLVTSIEVAQ